MKLTLLLTALVAAATPALSTIYITNPVSNTKLKGGDKVNIHWQDNGQFPKTSDWGAIDIWLAAGSESSQYKLDKVASNLSTSRSSRSYTIPKNIGPSGQYYFFRFESQKAAANGTATYMAFSARFNLSGMSGNFNSTVLAAAQGKEGSASSTEAAASSTATSAAAATAGASSTAAAAAASMATSKTSSAGSSADTVSAMSGASTSSGQSSGAFGGVAVPHNAAAAAVALGAVAAGAVALL
ncbi:unnamed protein product [Jaminaea pallidilutea]